MKIAFNPSTVAALIAPPNNKDITFDLRGHNIFARGVKFCGTDTNTWRDIKINNVSIDSNILDLRDGDNTTLTNINGVVTINSTWRPVVDNLTSDSTTSSLSAKQGKVLKALIDGKSNSGHTHDDRYLKLTGGTMASNALITFADSGSWGTDKGPQGARGGLYWTGQSDYAKLYAEETAGDNLDLVIQFGDDNSNGLSIRNKANTQTSYISAGGVITTGTFKGNLDWSYITNKPSSYTPSAHTHAWNSLTHSSTTENQAILTNGKVNGWKLQTLNIARWDNAANNAHSHSNKSVLDGITSALVNNWNIAFTFVNTITGTDTDKVINKWDEIVNFLAGITEDNKLNTLLNSKLSVYELANNTNVGAIKNNGIYYSTSDASSGTLTNSPFNTGFALINMTSLDNGDDLRRSRLAFNAYGEIKVSDDRDQANTAETWYNILTSKNSGISGSTIKLNGTSITVYSSSTADGRYVKKSGDTMSGVLTIDTTNFGALTIKRNDDANGASIQFRGKSSVYGYIGLNNSTKDKQFLRWNSDTSKTYIILDTSSTYVSSGKGVINGTTITQVDNATNSTNSTNARKLVNWYSTRPTSLNAQFGDGSLRIFYATSSTTEGKPAEDSHILHLAWDNNGGWDTQLAVHTRSGKVSTRAQNSGTWQPWKTLAFTTDIPSSLKNPYSLTTFGVVYDGSAAKTVTTSTFISQVTEGTSTITDGTMFITSYASNSGFADTNAVNVPYKRKAIHLWEYVKAKTDSLYAVIGHNHDDRYLKLTGGVLKGQIILPDIDVNTSYTGSIIIGASNTENLGIDGNEIMARNNGKASTLYLNNEGGAVQLGAILRTNSNIAYIGSQSTQNMIKFINNTNDPYGNGIAIGGGGLTIIGSGESSDVVMGQHSSGGDENMIIAGDGNIDFYSNLQDGWQYGKHMYLDTNGFLFTPSYINIGGNENNNSSPDRVWGSNSSDSYLRSYRTSALKVSYANSAGSASKVYGQVGDTGLHELVRCDMNNDQFRIIAGSSGHNNGWAEIATADDGSEPIYVRQYTGVFSTIKHTLTLLDGNGNTIFPGSLSIGGNIIFPNSSHLLWNSGSWYQRILLTDDSTADTAVFTFQQSSDSGTNWSNLMTIRDNGKIIANTFVGALQGNASTATKLQTARTIWGQSFNGTADVNGTIYINNSDSSNGAIRLNNDRNSNARISAISDQVIFNTSNAIRFGETAWDWNQWAGLKYTHSNKTIYLGIADNSIFNANSTQSGGTLNLRAGISNIDLNSGTSIRGLPTDGSPYNSSITLRDASIYLSAYGNISMSTGPGTINLTAGQGAKASIGSDFKIESSRGVYLNSGNSGNVWLCQGGGNVSIGYSSPSYKLDVNGQMRASGFHHSSMNSNNYILLAGGGYKSYGGNYDNPIFLGYLNLERGNNGTISSSFYCLGYSVSFTYTRGGNYCKISIPDTTYLSFYIRAAIASVNYSGGGMDTWTGYRRGVGAWWLHCYAYSSNEVRVKGFRQANDNNDSWWGGNPLIPDSGGANRITVCIFGYVTFR